MCGTCGCGTDVHAHDHDHDHVHGRDHAHAHASHAAEDERARTIRLEQAILAKNQAFAERNRGWFEAMGVVALDLVGAPGAGKTALLARTIRELGSELDFVVVEGDQETGHDAERIRETGCRVVQINTGRGCHLEARGVGEAVRALSPARGTSTRGSVVVIENVGNLVCPALFDLGERAKVVVLSVTEGEDKPLKYPHAFRAATALVVNKIDLVPHLEVDLDRCIENARRVNPALRIFPVSSTRGDGLDAWLGWLREEAARAATALTSA